MISKITVLCAVLAISYIEAVENREPTLYETMEMETSPEYQRFKRQQHPFYPVATLLAEPINQVAQAGSDPFAHVHNNAAQVARYFPLRQKRHLQPIFSILGDHFDRVAKAFDGLAGRDKSDSNSDSNSNSNSDSDSNSNRSSNSRS